jgi:hypothetical protein
VLVDDDRLPPAILVIVLGRDHQATDRDLGPDSDRKADIALMSAKGVSGPLVIRHTDKAARSLCPTLLKLADQTWHEA